MLKCFAFIAALLFGQFTVSAQTCPEEYWVKAFDGDSLLSLETVVQTSDKGNLLMGSSNAPGNFKSVDGWVARTTRQGNMLWSKQLKVPGYPRVTLVDAVEGKDSSFLVIGRLDSISASTNLLIAHLGLLCHIDKFGNVLFAKSFQPTSANNPFTFMRRMVQLPDGKILILATIVDPLNSNTSNELLCFNERGDQLWGTRFSSSAFQFRLIINKIEMAQLPGGQIVVALNTSENYVNTDPTGSFYRRGFYALCVDGNTGQKVWDNTLILTKRACLANCDDVYGIARMGVTSTGNLGIALSLPDSTNNMAPMSSMPAFVTLNAQTGALENTITYTGYSDHAYLTAATSGKPGNQQWMVDILNKGSALLTLDLEGQLLEQSGFAKLGNPEFSSSLHQDNGHSGIWYGSSDGNLLFRYTNNQGKIECNDLQPNFTMRPNPALFSKTDGDFKVTAYTTQATNWSTGFLPVSYRMLNTRIAVSEKCVRKCCPEIADTSQAMSIPLCAGSSTRLPDGTLVTEEGRYFVLGKTSQGCDSVSFFDVLLIPDPDSLKATPDTCLGDAPGVTLSASPGFGSYVWNGAPQVQNTFRVNSPGTFTVAVSNTCGSKSLKILVDQDCLGKLLLPNAFTPNGDGLNDYFQIPRSLQNRFKLVQLDIYSRWGDLLFRADEGGRGWDGKSRGELMPSGTYMYKIIARTLNGTLISNHGQVLLIR